MTSTGPSPSRPWSSPPSKGRPGFEQAVTIVVAKRAGTNATELARRACAPRWRRCAAASSPPSVEATVTRNYGETAGEKSNELIEHLLIATLSVIALILLAMGWRSALVVAVAVPVTLALTLLLTYLLGYTLNRVTLFALIFSIGILVDDAIVVVENIHRHIYLPGPRRSFARIVRRGGGRGRQPDHPRHLRGHRRHPADGASCAGSWARTCAPSRSAPAWR